MHILFWKQIVIEYVQQYCSFALNAPVELNAEKLCGEYGVEFQA